MKKTGFGPPKPLPGQADFKINESELLERDAKAMEERLKSFQARMLQQQAEDEAVPKIGGARWKSARADKGTVRSYAKDVQDQYRKKSDSEGGGDPALRATATGRRQARSQPDVENWSIDDVNNWIVALGLQQHAAAFAGNEISGNILLDISLDDLDYMGITVLAHRKTILKSIEELRKNKRATGVLSRTLSEPKMSDDVNLAGRQSQTDEDIQSSSRPAVGGNVSLSASLDHASSAAASVSRTHWSHLEPLSSNKVSSTGVAGAVNPADGVLDEEAERLAFMDAVSEWRHQGNGKVAIVREGNVKFGAAEDGAWRNPFGPADTGESASSKSAARGPVMSSGDLDEQAERAAFQAAVMEWRTGSTAGGAAGAPSAVQDARATASSSSSSSASAAVVSPRYFRASESESSRPLGEGTLDEAAEHEEFVRAVQSWRQSKSDDSSARGSASGRAAVQIVHVGPGGAGASNGDFGRRKAAELASGLDKQQQQLAEQLEQRKALATQRLQEASLQLQRSRDVLECRTGRLHINDDDDHDHDHDDCKPDMSDDLDGDYDDAPLSPSSSIDERQFDCQLVSPGNTPRRVEVSLIESSMGLPDIGNVNESYYVVECSSDEED